MDAPGSLPSSSNVTQSNEAKMLLDTFGVRQKDAKRLNRNEVLSATLSHPLVVAAEALPERYT